MTEENATRKVSRRAPRPRTGERGDATRGQQGPIGAAEGDLDEPVRRRAYEIWERVGRPDGAAEEHWRQAKRELGVEEAPSDQVAPHDVAPRTSAAPAGTPPDPSGAR